MGYSEWASEQLFLDNDDFYRDLIQEMEKAEHSIDMEVFTFEQGVLAYRLYDTFRKVIQRGVEVRLIADGWGSPNFWNTIGPKLEAIGVKIRIHRSLPWHLNRHNLEEPPFWLGRFWFRWRRINRGFHRKVTLIDRKIAWISSLNVTDVHLKEVYGKNAWADVGGRFTGEEVEVLFHAFERAFFRKRWIKLKPSPRYSLVLLNDSFFQRRRTTFIQKRRLKRAMKRVWIQTPYFLPERSLLRALYQSAKRKVDVRVLIPEKNDQPIVKLLSFALFSQLTRRGIKIFEYQPRFAHKKVLIVDDLYTIGSTNFNHRSFLHDLEVEVHLTASETCGTLEQSFRDDLQESIQIDQKVIARKPIWYRTLGRILFFLRFWC